ncbi:MAG: HAD family hydrolase [Betaproteobacteria bacterium]|jgi:HAD superfamily hydrolase (TIGR01490 family)|nr:HAD family hydrolase [Betaproteobacteria bacterium]
MGLESICLFDLDHTLLPLDSDHAWGEFTTRLGWTDAQTFAQRNDDFYRQYQQGELDIHAYVRFATQAARQRGLKASAEAHQAFMREVIGPAIRPQATALVQRHREQGDRLLIVTATNEFVTAPIAQAFGIDTLIAVQLERDPSGELTGRITGTPSFGVGKVVRLQQWLENQGLTWSGIRSTFYSDSINDLPLLEKVNHPVATNPDARLRTLAQERGWPILELFTSP